MYRASVMEKLFLWICVLSIGFTLSTPAAFSRSAAAQLDEVRIGDFPTYTQIALELSSDRFQCQVIPQKTNPQSLQIKLTGAVCSKKTMQSDNPALSEIRFSSSSTQKTVTLTIPLKVDADIDGVQHHVWKDLVIVDIPLKKQNPLFPTQEEIKAFIEKGGKVIVLDPGHGAYRTGAIGGHSCKWPRLEEKTVALDVGKRLKAYFDTQPDKYMAILTRYGDYLPAPFGAKGSTRDSFYSFVSLPHRIQMAKDFYGSVFISIHLNGLSSNKARGFEILYFSDVDADKLYNNSQNMDLEELSLLGVDKSDKDNFIISAIKRDKIPQENKLLAGAIVQEIKNVPGVVLRPKTFVPRRIRVLKQINMPSVLVELAFLTNPTDHELARQTTTRDKMAKSIFTAVEKYFFKPTDIPPPTIVSNTTTTTTESEPISAKPVIPEYHTVRRNETLSSIAAKYNLSVNTLKALNKGKIGPRSRIYVDTKLRLRGGITSSSSTSRTRSQSSAGSIITYKVQALDTLAKIADQYNTSVKDIMALNGKRTVRIYPGDRLRIRPGGKYIASAKPKMYKVRKRDSLSGIAERFNISVSQLMRINGLKRSKIVVGQVLKIPS